MLENLKVNLIYLVVGALIATFLVVRFVPKPKPVFVSVPASLETEDLKKKIAELTAQKKSVIKEYNCANGALSKESVIDETTVKKLEKTEAEKSKKVEALVVAPVSLNLLLGLGVQFNEVLQFSDIGFDKIKPQLAAGLVYGDYGGFVSSNLKDSHSVYAFRNFILNQ